MVKTLDEAIGLAITVGEMRMDYFIIRMKRELKYYLLAELKFRELDTDPKIRDMMNDIFKGVE